MIKSSHVSIALTCLGAAGVVLTSVLTANAVPKASKLIEKAEFEKRDELTKMETVKAAAPAYIPPILAGVGTIACIFGANVCGRKSQASLMSAYALLDRSYREYSKKLKELYGDEADGRIRAEVAKDEQEENGLIIPEGEQLFFDYNSFQYFTATIDDVLQKTVTDDGLECYIISTPFDTLPPFD